MRWYVLFMWPLWLLMRVALNDSNGLSARVLCAWEQRLGEGSIHSSQVITSHCRTKVFPMFSASQFHILFLCPSAQAIISLFHLIPCLFWSLRQWLLGCQSFYSCCPFMISPTRYDLLTFSSICQLLWEYIHVFSAPNSTILVFILVHVAPVMLI